LSTIIGVSAARRIASPRLIALHPSASAIQTPAWLAWRAG